VILIEILDKNLLFLYTLHYKVICKGKYMSEKDEALQHLSAIKSALVDKDSFFPYNYNALIVWGVIGSVMTFVMPSLIKTSVMWGTVFSVICMSVGFMIEGFLTKKVNKNYDIESCTRKQRFIATTFTLLTFFAIALSALLAKYDLIIPLFVLWMFLCGFGYYVVGYVLNIKLFTAAGYLSMGAAMVLLSVSYFMENLGSVDSVWFYFSQGVSFAVLGVVPVLMGRKLKEDVV
jgi:hypothetical protein